jgi:hypothetical protein
VFVMSIAWGFIAGAVCCVVVVLMTSLRIAFLEERHASTQNDASPPGAPSGQVVPSSRPSGPRAH